MRQQVWILLVCALLATACERKDLSPKPSVAEVKSLAVFNCLSYFRGEYLLLEQ